MEMIKKILCAFIVTILIISMFLCGVITNNKFILHSVKATNIYDEIYYAINAERYKNEYDNLGSLSTLKIENKKHNILRDGQSCKNSRSAKYMSEYGLISKSIYNSYNVPSNKIICKYDKKALKKFGLDSGEIMLSYVSPKFSYDHNFVNKQNSKGKIVILLSKKLTNDMNLFIWINYDFNKKQLCKYWAVDYYKKSFDLDSCDDKCEDKVEKYNEKIDEEYSGLMYEYLDSIYSELVDKYFLKELAEKLDSKYSSNKYGKITVIDWEKDSVIEYYNYEKEIRKEKKLQ